MVRIISISFLCFSFIIIGCKEASEYKKPNVVFILADDLGYHDLSCTGSVFYETPNIDRIAEEGTIFTQGYATCQVCSPSRASIMTGQFPARHGITDWIGAKTGEDWRKANRFNQLLPPDYTPHLPHENTTLAEAMKSNGYTTFFAGKWHLGAKGSWPTDHGFDINKGGWDKGSPIGGFFSPWENPNLENQVDGENLSIRLAKETAQFISKNKEAPFFAFLSFYAVHSPIQTSKEKWSKYRDKAEQLGIEESGFKMGHYLPIRQVQDNPVYAGLLETMDEAVGLVLQALEEAGLDDNTIIIFTSDNGGVAAGDAFATSNQPLRGGKGYQYEGGIREPFFIKVPWLQEVKNCTVPVTGTDFYPTILELIGSALKPEEHTDGQSLVPLLQKGQIKERPLIWHYPHYGNQGGRPSSIIRKGQWKLIHYYEEDIQELFDLENDLRELNNVASEHPEKVMELKDELFSFLKEVGANFPEKDSLYNAAKEQAYLKKVIEERWPNLEKQRLNYLSPDFDPKNNWWGSDISASSDSQED